MWCKLAVIRAKRQQGKFEILPKAMDLCVYTITICKSEKSFPKRNRWILTQPIVNEVIAILTNVRYANSVRIVEREDYLYRRQMQVEAFAHSEALLSLIEIAYNCLNLEPDRVEYWVGLVVEVEDRIKGWQKSDRERYKAMLANTGDTAP